MKKLAVVLISLAGVALSPVTAFGEETAPAKPTTKKKPSVKKSKPAKKAAATAVGAAAAQPAAPAIDAAAAQALATKHACLSCHKVDAKLIGPAFKEVSVRYKGDKTAEAKLISKVKQGGSGAWGTIPMPPHPQVPDADMKTMVQWVLSLK